jgi:arsenate reductase
MDSPTEILFVCTGNSARSQMAEGFARHLGQDRVAVQSAGMEPKPMNAHAVRVMRERGIDISGQQSKAFDWDLARQMDVVVTVCGHANESCPVLPPEVMRLHWPLEDPAAAQGSEEEILTTLRKSRDQIEAQVRGLVRDLIQSSAPGR